MSPRLPLILAAFLLLAALSASCANRTESVSALCPPCPSCALDPAAQVKTKPAPAGVLPPHASATKELGPETAILYHLVAQYEPAKFNHRAHTGYASNCVDCHHHAKSVEDFPPCRECHGAAFKDITRPGLKGAYHRQCMNCHRKMESGPLGCEDCHKPRSDKDTTETLTKRNAPATVQLGHLAKEYPAVRFDHKLHEEVSDSCKTCHHQAGEVELAPPCRECHSASAALPGKKLGLKDAYHQQCLSCHKHMGGDAPQQCAGCHKQP